MTYNATQLRIPTLYPTPKEVSKIMGVVIDLIKGGTLFKDENGFCSIDEVCQVIKEGNPSLTYFNRNHIVELFFKDADKKILISGLDKIKYKEVKYVQPPKILYFGTVEGFVEKMVEHGIRSNTKGYIKLYDTEEKACSFAKKFMRDGEQTVAIVIDADGAFSDGLKFSTFQDGEYIVVRLHRKYIRGVV